VSGREGLRQPVNGPHVVNCEFICLNTSTTPRVYHRQRSGIGTHIFRFSSNNRHSNTQQFQSFLDPRLSTTPWKRTPQARSKQLTSESWSGAPWMSHIDRTITILILLGTTIYRLSYLPTYQCRNKPRWKESQMLGSWKTTRGRNGMVRHAVRMLEMRIPMRKCQKATSCYETYITQNRDTPRDLLPREG
jgi:hypothetical protein